MKHISMQYTVTMFVNQARYMSWAVLQGKFNVNSVLNFSSLFKLFVIFVCSSQSNFLTKWPKNCFRWLKKVRRMPKGIIYVIKDNNKMLKTYYDLYCRQGYKRMGFRRLLFFEIVFSSFPWGKNKRKETNYFSLKFVDERTYERHTEISGLWMMDSGCWTLDAGLRTLDAGLWKLEARLWTLGIGC